MRNNIRPFAILIFVSNVLLSSADDITRTFVLEPSTVGIQRDAVDPQAAVRDFFGKAGVDLGSVPAPQFFYNARTGILHITAEETRMREVQELLAQHQRPTPLVTPTVLFKVILAEYAESDELNTRKKLGLSRVDSLTCPDTLQDLLKAPRTELFSRVLTETEARNLIKVVETQTSADILSPAPKSTASGRQIRIAFEDSEPITIPPFHAPARPASDSDSFAQ